MPLPSLDAIRSMFPGCNIRLDSNGQVVIDTNMCHKDGELFSMEKCPHCDMRPVVPGYLCSECNRFFDEMHEQMVWKFEMEEGDEGA